MKAYVSGALTGIENFVGLKKFYEDIAEVCAAVNIEAYVPHLLSDPLKNPQLTCQDVYVMDRNKVTEADIVIAYAGVPSIGVGQEIEIAHQHEIPILLMMEKDAKVSRMARGNPSVTAEIRFDSYEDALVQLSHWLHGWRQ